MPGSDHPRSAKRGHTRRDDIAADATRQRNHDDSTAFARFHPRQAVRYIGVADRSGRHVWVERNGLRSSLRHGGEDDNLPYTWGRPGLGARELARALLFDATGSIALAERFCRELTHEVVAYLPEPQFALERDDVLAWLASRH